MSDQNQTPTTEEATPKTLDEIIASIDLNSVNLQGVLADLFQTFNYITIRVSVAMRLLEKLAERDLVKSEPTPEPTEEKNE